MLIETICITILLLQMLNAFWVGNLEKKLNKIIEELDGMENMMYD